MSQFQWSETFLSIEGEAKYTGHPTVYVRFAKCNFRCQGFNNPNNVEITNEVLGFNPSDYSRLTDLPSIEIGCDSIYSWDDRFKHMWTSGDETKLAEELVSRLSHRKWYHPETEMPTILSITGGEPTSRAKALPDLLNHPLLDDVEHLLIETNCSVPLKQSFIDQLNKWTLDDRAVCTGDRTITWSNSPKLSVSGEPHIKAIRPDVALMQRRVSSSEQYFKFVCGPSKTEFDEVEEVMKEYYAAGIQQFQEVYIMPVSCTEEQQLDIAADVADMCIDRGYIYCHRVHNTVYKNAIGK